MQSSDRWFLILSAPLVLAGIWLLSGLFSSGGMFFFISGITVLGGCLIAALAKRRRPLFALYLTVLMAVIVISLLEGFLRLSPGLLAGTAANHAFGRYHCRPGGIYQRDDHLGHALRPNHSCRLYWNGHWWHHQTNEQGYRGMSVPKADAVFLGDSMIYGHGVENDQTVPSQFAATGGWRVANLGQQGACLIQMAIRFRRIGVGLTPRIVFVCCHDNDIWEASAWYPEDELKRFSASALEDAYEPRTRTQFRERPWWRLDHHTWDMHLAPSLRIAGMAAGFRKATSDGGIRTRSVSDREFNTPYVPPVEKLREPFATWATTASDSQRLGWQAHGRALEQIGRLCRQHGAHLVLFDIGYPYEFSAAIEALADRIGAVYSAAGRVALQRALSNEDVYLANDGHWSPRGCTIVAEELQATAQKLRTTPHSARR